MLSGLGVVVVAAGKGKKDEDGGKQAVSAYSGKADSGVFSGAFFQGLKEVDSIVLVTGESDVERCRDYIEQYGLYKVKSVVAGGSERQHSVYEGLQALPDNTEWVMVHDAVRPFARPEAVLSCWRHVREKDAAVLAVPVKDTIKVVNDAGAIESTPDRCSLWAIQTPQAFRLSLLMEAHKRAAEEQFIGTDDSMLVERIGYPVHVVESDYTNVKITTPDDLLMAEWILGQRKEEQR